VRFEPEQIDDGFGRGRMLCHTEDTTGAEPGVRLQPRMLPTTRRATTASEDGREWCEGMAMTIVESTRLITGGIDTRGDVSGRGPLRDGRHHHTTALLDHGRARHGEVSARPCVL
jgi:hypothetical protein